MNIIPLHCSVVNSTPFYNLKSAPTILMQRHKTLQGDFGRISVICGALQYYGFLLEDTQTADISQTISAGQFYVVTSEFWHKLDILTPDTYFNIDFFS